MNIVHPPSSSIKFKPDLSPLIYRYRPIRIRTRSTSLFVGRIPTTDAIRHPILILVHDLKSHPPRRRISRVYSGTGTLSAHRDAWKPSKLPTDPTRRCTLVLLLDRERARSLEERRGELGPSEDEVEDARRWRCIRVGSTSWMFARRAKRERTTYYDRCA